MTTARSGVVKTDKGQQTRAAILEAALEMFRARGYEQTTMRAIADEAGVALGNAYYYFHSKEHLIQAFYGKTHEEHLVASASILEKERDLKARLLGVLRSKFEMLEPYHQFAGKLFKTAADPQSPLNPFSDESNPVRQQSIALFAKVVEGSNAKVPKELLAELPFMLWLYHMGLTLFWIHDASPKRSRTFRLVNRTVDILVRLIGLASNPLMKPLRKSAIRLIEELREDVAAVPGEA
ncbi:MAG TPA: TetR family transcriptional regulator [Blastocatellia bacterium]|nr:TetR family transcriptional regulator [Blastocatellia bacterium]